MTCRCLNLLVARLKPLMRLLERLGRWVNK